MSSADDADDERDSPAPPPVEDWIDPKQLKFTVFIVLPNEEVCTLRDVPSGTSVIEVKGRLELLGGIPCQIYCLKYPDGEELADDKKLVVKETILHGYLLKVHLYANWDSLYLAVTRNCIEQVYHSGGVHLKGNIHISSSESGRFEGVVSERGMAALYMASYLGLQRMANMLISVGVNVNGTTIFGRTPLHAAVAKDRVAMADFLLKQGASLQKADCYGVVPIELAKQMSSTLCFRKLRLMVLNLRGNNGVSSSNRPRPLIKLDISIKRPESIYADRAQSNLSQYSDGSALTKYSSASHTHASRKHISSSAPVEELKRNGLLSRERTQSTLSSATTGNIRQSKGNVKWKETQTEYTYLKHLNFPKKGTQRVEETVKIKPMPLTQPKTILKFANIVRSGPEVRDKESAGIETTVQNEVKDTKQLKFANIVRSGPEVRDKESAGIETTIQNEVKDTKQLKNVMKYSKERLNYFKKLAAPVDEYIPMKDRKKRDQSQPEVSGAFKTWLDKKTAEIEDAEETSTSIENFNESESEEDKLREFNKRVRKKNREAVRSARSVTPVNKFVREVLEFGSTEDGDSRNPSAELNIPAYKEWRRKRRGYLINLPKAKNANDLITERRRLEEKRQRLLMNAISYEEWMDHTEERKLLIKQILKADQEEMRMLEEEKLRYRRRMFSYNLWTEKLQKRNAEDKKRKDIQRKYEEERRKEKTRAGTSSTAVPFEDWLRKKRLMTSKETNRSSDVGANLDKETSDELQINNEEGSVDKNEKSDSDENDYGWLLRREEHSNGQNLAERLMNGSVSTVQTRPEVTT